MNTKDKARAGLSLYVLCILCVLSAAAAAAQIIGSSRTALAMVEDLRTRRPIIGLGADDFVVQEGNESRDVLSVRPADYPVVLMVDAAGPGDDLPLIVTAARRFIEHLGSERAVALGTFGSRPKLLAGFEAERAELLKQVDDITATAPAGGSVLQAAGLAAEALAPTHSPFSSVVILSAGTEPAPAGDQPEPDTVAGIVARGAIVHIVAVAAHSSARADPARTMTLSALAEQTRGQFISIYSAASFEAALGQIATRMASELMVEYIVPNDSRAAEVKLGVRVPGARVRGLGVR